MSGNDSAPPEGCAQPSPAISVVVRVCTKTDEIFRLLESLKTQTLPPAEIVLIDSESADWVVEGLKKLQAEGLPTRAPRPAPVKLLRIPKAEFQSARALNRAMMEVSHDLVAILSQDAVTADDHYLEALAEPFRDPRIAGTYGRQIITDGPPDPLGEKDLLKTYPPESRTQAYPECWFVNTCSMIRRHLWWDHPFDEGAVISEDHEWALWAQRQGYLVRYVAEAKVKHHHRYVSLAEIWKRHHAEGLGLAYIHRKRLGPLKAAAWWAREALSDATWLMSHPDGSLLMWPQAVMRRLVKFAALFSGHRGASLPGETWTDAHNAARRDEVLRLDGVWRLFRLWKKRPTTLKDRFVHLFHRDRAAYEEFWALRDVSFSVRRGEMIGICGSNGSGKSTLLKVIARIAPATHGTITVRGRVAPLLEVATGFHPDLSGRENIALNASILGLSPEEIAAKRDSIIEFAELGEFIDCPVKTYSAGMYMRLGFSVLTHVEADILLIDEVLAVGDARFQAKCQAWMRRLRNQGVTALIVSHDLQTMVDLCDRVIWMDKGRVVADGPPREVLAWYCPSFVPAPPAPETEGASPAGEPDERVAVGAAAGE